LEKLEKVKLEKYSFRKSRAEREKITVETMIHMYCHAKHGSNGELCDSCSHLSRYAVTRYEKCPFGEIKPECSICPVHCYKPEEKDTIKKVMRYAGPWMMIKHPVMAIDHLPAKWKYPPEKALDKIASGKIKYDK
jgi:hypothetical protein